MLRGAVIALKYALFAAVATGVNLSSQWVGLQLYSGPWSLAAAMAAGTATGLAAKYLLDKQLDLLRLRIPASRRMPASSRSIR